MSETLSFLSLSFWLALAALAFFGIQAWNRPETALRLPMLAVLFTVTTWYFGDVWYNDYPGYVAELGPAPLESAWWEVLIFISFFGLITPVVFRWVNPQFIGRPSVLLDLSSRGGIDAPRWQDQFDLICSRLAVAWVLLMGVGLYRAGFDFPGVFMPYLGHKVDPWSRGRLGAGLDSLLAFAGYLQIAFAALFGVLLAVTARSRTFTIAATICLLALPGFIFDRTRSTMLATLLPGFLAWVFLRLRSGTLIRIAVLAVGFLVLEGWLKFVIANRGENTIASAFQKELNSPEKRSEESRHLGLNMLEELGYINSFIHDGTYRVNWGQRYFAELVNPIPRALWHGKPMIGIDYAVARGMTWDDANTNGAGVGATISTGMIGQGVVNFGWILGPMAAALLMALWASILARQDMLGMEPGRIFLYALGMVLTFNMGRDITLLVIYPFCFAYLMLLLSKIWRQEVKTQVRPSRVRPPSGIPNRRPDY